MSTEILSTPEKKQLEQQWQMALDEAVMEDAYAFNALLNKPPKNEWIKVNKHANNSKYVPIRIVENLLRTFFPAWKAEIVGNTRMIANHVTVDVQLYVYHPILKIWLTYPGTGAVPVQTKKDTNPMDINNIIPNALHKNAPAALSFAISNAAKKIGKVFGSDLNNDEVSEFYKIVK